MSDLVEAIRKEIIKAFADVPMPLPEDVYDKTDRSVSGQFEDFLSDTDYYQEVLAGKHWTDVETRKIYGICGLTLSQPAYRYYVQACLASRIEGDPLGIDPSDVFLAGRHNSEIPDQSGFDRPWYPYLDEEDLEPVFDAKQLDAIATYIWFYAQSGYSLAASAFEWFWKKYVQPDGIIRRLGLNPVVEA